MVNHKRFSFFVTGDWLGWDSTCCIACIGYSGDIDRIDGFKIKRDLPENRKVL